MSRYLPFKDFRELNLGIRDVTPGYGTGNWRVFGASTSWTVPTGVNQVRVTALGAGGSPGIRITGNYNDPKFAPNCQPTDAEAMVAPGGGGGGGYIVATVNVTAGCSCCIVVGAGGGSSGSDCSTTSCCLTVIGCCIWCGTDGGCSKFGTAVCALGGAAGKTFSCCCAGNSCLGRGGTGGGAAANTSVATILACYCGNVGCCGGYVCLGPVASCANCTSNLYGAPGGASGSPLGGAGTGPFPGTLLTDIYNCRNFAGGAYDETCTVAKYSGTTPRWDGEAIISTYYAVGGGCQVAGTAVCGPNGFRVTMYGGSQSSTTQCTCQGAGCTMANLNCRACTSAYYAAGCGGGGSSYYQTCYLCVVSYGDGKTNCCAYCGLCRRSGQGESGNGLVIVEW